MLSYHIFAENNQHMNRVVCSQLAVETIRRTARCLVKIFEDTNNGNADCQSMCE